MKPDAAVTTAVQRLRCAQAVSIDGVAHLLDDGNTRIGSTDLESAVDDDVPFYVRVRPDLLAVDFDQPDAPERADRLTLHLLVRGFRSLTTDSGGGNHRHVFAEITSERELAEQIAFARSLGGDVRRAIRPPLARHRLGGRSVPVSPTTSDLASGLTSGRISALPQTTRDLLDLEITEVADRSRVLNSIALSMINANWTLADFELALHTPGTVVHEIFGARVRLRGPERALEWAKRYVWEDATSYVARHPARATADGDLVRRLLLWGEQQTWNGRTGPTDRAVFLALLSIRGRSGRQTFTASQRDLAEVAGISRRSVTEALRRLEYERKIVERRSGKRVSRPDFHGSPAAGWRFVEVGLPAAAEGVSFRVLDHLGHDLFRYQELGKGCQLIFDTVAGLDGVSNTDLREVTGLSAKVIRLALERLEENELVGQGVDRLWRYTGVDLDDVAQRRGIAPYGAAQRALHAQERTNYLTRG